MSHARYITYGGNPVVSQPYSIQGVTSFGFSLSGDRRKMQALCDLTLNHAPDLRYRVASPTVLFSFMRMRDLRSTVLPDCEQGCYREDELNVCLLLVAEEKLGPLWIPKRLVWYMPYLWLDCGPAMIAGRDVYGYPKQYGTLALPAALGEPAQFRASGEVFQHFPPAAHSIVGTIVSARRTDGANVELADPWSTLEDACEGFFRQLVTADLPDLLTGLAVSTIGPAQLLNLVFLRQLRSIGDGAFAAYQSIAETTFDVTGFRSAGLLAGTYEIEIPKQASSPIAAELGFASDAAGNVRRQAELACFIDFDFRLNCGRELWVAR